MKAIKNISTEKKLNGFIFTVTSISVIIIIGVTVLLSYLLMTNSKQVMYKQFSSIIEANGRELQLNVDNYLKHVSRTATLLFSEEEYVNYYPNNTTMTDYEKLTLEQAMKNRIMDICILDNFSDFFVVYTSDKYIGTMSNTTSAAFAEAGFYKTFTSWITDEKTHDGWSFGEQEINDRLYYVKRFNNGAVIVISFYSHELSTCFEAMKELGDINIELLDGDNRILYALDKNKIASYETDSEALELLSSNYSAHNTVDEFIIKNDCCNGWIVLCSVEAATMLTDISSLRNTILLISISLAAVAVVVLLLIVRKMFKTMGGMVNRLENKAYYDQLSKVLNKQSFKDNVENIFRNSQGRNTFIFCMFDVDNFKQINDNLGHNHGDKVITKMGALLNSSFKNDYSIVGRLGGDEFAIFMTLPSCSDAEVIEMMDKKMSNFITTFANVFWEESAKLNVSVSIGVTYTGDFRSSFDRLYHEADAALYKSKKGGKNQFNYYEGGDWE